MTHITLNTGHSVVQSHRSIQPGTLDLMSVLLPDGGNLGKISPQLSAFRVKIESDPYGAYFSIYRGSEAIVRCAACWSQEHSQTWWESLERVYLQLSDDDPAGMAARECPEMPESTPWLGVVILHDISHQTRNNIEWLGDFEHCLARLLMREAGQ